jgi:hypothetical protein
MLLQNFAVSGVDVIADRHATVLIDDFLAFFGQQPLDEELGGERMKGLEGSETATV